MLIVSYKTGKPGLAHSGDYFARRMDGKFYILKKNDAVIRHECVIEADRNNSQNRSLFTNEREQQQVRYHFTGIYRRHDGRYMVSYLDCDKTYVNPRGEQVTRFRKAHALEIQRQPVALYGRDYFEDTSFAEDFWSDFKQPE